MIHNNELPQYFLGGALKKLLPAAAGAAASFIPGVGPAIAPLVATGVGAAMGGDKKKQPDSYIEKNASASYGYAQGGAIDFLGQNAVAFTGPKHENGGIPTSGGEVEGGETMDLIFKNGQLFNNSEGQPYVFSNRLKLPDSSATFAQAHKRLVKNNASEDEIRKLAMLQETVSGRSGNSGINIPTTDKAKAHTSAKEYATTSKKKKATTSAKQYAGTSKMQKAEEPNDVEPDNDRDDKFAAGGPIPPLNSVPPDWYVSPKGVASDIIGGTPPGFGSRALPGSNPAGLLGEGSSAVEPGLNTITTYSPMLEYGMPILAGTALGVGAGQAYAGKTIPEAYSQWSKSKQNLAEAKKRRIQAEQDKADTKDYVDKMGTGKLLYRNDGMGMIPDQTSFGPQDLIVRDGQPNKQNKTTQSATSNNGSEPYTPDISGDQPISDVNISSAEAPSATINNGVNASSDGLQLAGDGSTPTAADVGKATTSTPGADSGMSSGLTSALQFVPELMNFATGALSHPKAPAPTKVSNRSVNDMPVRVNANPELTRNERNYRAILADPNATINQKLAAQAQKQVADSRVYADKFNQENRMKSNRARVQHSIDSQNAQYRNQRRGEQAQMDANFGPTGNIARQAIGSASQKLLMQQAQKNQAKQNKVAALAALQGMDPVLRKKYINELGLLD